VAGQGVKLGLEVELGRRDRRRRDLDRQRVALIPGTRRRLFRPFLHSRRFTVKFVDLLVIPRRATTRQRRNSLVFGRTFLLNRRQVVDRFFNFRRNFFLNRRQVVGRFGSLCRTFVEVRNVRQKFLLSILKTFVGVSVVDQFHFFDRKRRCFRQRRGKRRCFRQRRGLGRRNRHRRRPDALNRDDPLDAFRTVELFGRKAADEVGLVRRADSGDEVKVVVEAHLAGRRIRRIRRKLDVVVDELPERLEPPNLGPNRRLPVRRRFADRRHRRSK